MGASRQAYMPRAVVLAVVLAAGGCGGDPEPETTVGSTEAEVPPPVERTTTDGRGAGEGVELGPAESANPDATEAAPEATALSEREVERVIEDFVTSDDPASCELATERLLDRSFGGLEGCRSLARRGVEADGVRFVSTKLAGPEAESVIIPRGGAADGLRIRVRVVRVDGEPRLDAFRAPDVAPGP